MTFVVVDSMKYLDIQSTLAMSWPAVKSGNKVSTTCLFVLTISIWLSLGKSIVACVLLNKVYQTVKRRLSLINI